MGSNTEKKPWIYKTHTKIEAKILRAITFAIAKLEVCKYNRRAITKWGAISKKFQFLKGNKSYFACWW
jgi:hypothetical protein